MNAFINIKAVPWKRTRTQGKRRYMAPELLTYYNELYAALLKAGFTPYMPAPLELRITLSFYFRDKRWRDTDNLLKAFQDAGQPRKWMPRKQRGFFTDLWDDKQFCEVHVYRVRGAGVDMISVDIEEVK